MSARNVDDRSIAVRDERDRCTRSLLRRAASAADPAIAQRLFEQAVLLNQSVARALAHKYRGRGVDPEDLLQVAMLGLVKAVRGYRPLLGKAFAAYAVPTISGEIKRHFRDRGWMIRPPRSLQELNHAVRVAEPDLAQELQRMPRTAEVAERLGVDACLVDEARRAGSGYRARSLDSPLAVSGRLLSEVAADPGDAVETVDTMLTLRPALRALGSRERAILRLRFVDNLTQEEIGRRIGVSQMQVSRLLKTMLAKLRASIEDEPAA